MQWNDISHIRSGKKNTIISAEHGLIERGCYDNTETETIL